MNKRFSYDKANDILFIHQGFMPDERFKGNLDAGDLILDISTKDRVRGVEIMSASDFLKEFDAGRDVLENLSDAEFNATARPSHITISLMLKSSGRNIPAKIAVPLSVG